MKKIVWILFGVLLLACGKDKPPKPDNLISEAKMSDIIYDVFLLNAAKGINKRILEKNGVMPQEYVYKKHNIDSLQFAQSNDYYSYDTKTYEEIMGRVKERIETEKTKYDSIVTREQELNDSISNSQKIELKLDTLEKKQLKPKQIPSIIESEND